MGAAKRQAVGIAIDGKHGEAVRQSDTVRTYYRICRGLDVDGDGDGDDDDGDDDDDDDDDDGGGDRGGGGFQ